MNDTMDRDGSDRSASRNKRELRGGERIILLFLSYIWVVRAHNKHNMVCKL